MTRHSELHSAPVEPSRMQKGVQLTTHAVRRPKDTRRYLDQSLLRRSSPLELGLPWFSYGAIDFLESHLRPDMVVYEYGSGGSTIFFAHRVAAIVSVENDPAWREAVHQRLADDGLANVTLKTAGFDAPAPDRFAESDFARALPDEPADVVVIDSYDYDTWQTHARRPQLLRPARERVRPGGIVVLDDSWRYPALWRNDPLARTFRGLGPARLTVTSTTVFFC